VGNLLNFTLSLTDLLGPKLAGLAERVEKFGRKVEEPHKVKVDTSQAEGGLGKLAGLAGKAFAAFSLFEVGKAVVGMGAGMEQTRVQFETFTGSVEKGNKVIADLQKFALDTPFEDEQVIAAGRGLLAFGESADSIQPTLTKLGNISSATGKDFNELISIWGKNKLSGVIQGEDLNQLNDSGIPVMESLAKQLKVNVSEVKKMGAEGKISFQMLDKAFDELGGPAGKWGDLMEKQSKTLAGRWSSLVGFAQNMGGKMGEALLPFLGKIVDSGNALLAFIQQNTAKIVQMFAPLVEAVQPFIDAVGEIYADLGLTGDGVGFLEGAFNGLATVINYLAPIIKIAAVGLASVYRTIWGVIGAVASFIETSPRLQKFFSGLYSGAVAVFKGIAEAASKFLGGLGGILEGVFTGNFSKIKDGLKDTFNALGAGPAVLEQAGQAAGEGYRKGFQKSTLFSVAAKPAGSDAASAFLGKKPAPVAPTMAAAAAKGNGTGASGSGQIKNITIRMNNLVGNMEIHAATMAEGAKEAADLVLRQLAGTLNDVNTIASA
jgi:tape measure domain-containing protein